MPDGVIHKKLWLANIPNAALAAALGFHPVFSAGIMAGYLLGNIVEPDLDLVQITRSEREMIDKIPFVGCLWFGYWAGYG